MEIEYLIVILILYARYGFSNPSCVDVVSFECGSSQETRKATVCKQDHNTKSVTIICLDSNITYYCRKARGNWNWDNTPNSSCLLNTGTTQTPAATTHETSTQTTSVITVTSMNQTHLSSETTLTATTTSKETTGQNSSEAVTDQTHVSLETSTYETTGTSLKVNTSDTTSSSASDFTTETSTYVTTGISLSVNTSARTSTSAPHFTTVLGDTETKNKLSSVSSLSQVYAYTLYDNGPVVAVAVSVSVVTVILVVLVVAFLLWRKRRQKSTPCAKLHTGNSFTNRSFEESLGLDRHISLLNIRSSQSVDSGYTEITLENLRSEETSGNVYHTIDSLPENQTACNGNYGHLKMKTTAFVDNNYSHIPINQANGNFQQDSTYAHTGGATLKPDMEDKIQYSVNTYNILETMPNMTTRVQRMDKQQESSIDDDESEYNHATAERSESSPESKADTYSHLNRTWQNQRANSHNDMQPIAEGSENLCHYSNAEESDNGKANLKKNNPEYSKCIDKKEDTENRRQVGSDGYEKASGVAHEYFVLDPDNDTADNKTSFHMIEDNFGDKPDDTEDAENPYHQYFTLD